MNIFSKVRETVVGAWAGASIGGSGLRSVVDTLEQSQVVRETGIASSDIKEGVTKVLESAFAELELAFEDVGWRGVGVDYGMWNFTRATLRRITALSRVMYLINPLI